MITDTKLLDYDLDSLIQDIKTINLAITKFETDGKIQEFEKELYLKLTKFNNKNFPSPNFKRKIYKKEIDENKY